MKLIQLFRHVPIPEHPAISGIRWYWDMSFSIGASLKSTLTLMGELADYDTPVEVRKHFGAMTTQNASTGSQP